MSQYVWGSVQTAADYRFETSSVCVSSACSCNMTWVCVFVFSRYTSSWYTCCLLWREDSHCRYKWIKWILLILLDQVFFHNNKCAAQRREKQSRLRKKVGNIKCSQINGGWTQIHTTLYRMKGYKYFFKTLYIEHKHLDGSPAAEPRPEGGSVWESGLLARGESQFNRFNITEWGSMRDLRITMTGRKKLFWWSLCQGGVTNSSHLGWDGFKSLRGWSGRWFLLWCQVAVG